MAHIDEGEYHQRMNIERERKEGREEINGERREEGENKKNRREKLRERD